MTIDLTGKVIAITGASQGIGEATARHLVSLGAKVALIARSADKLIMLADELGDAALALPCDVSDHAALTDTLGRANKELGSIDVLVNNAGVIDPIARIADSEPTAWAKALEVNVLGVYNGIRAVLPEMEARGSGTIINISSGAATGALEGWSHYCASKAAVLSLTRCTHKEVGQLGILSVGLSPGTVATDMQRAIQASGVNPVSQMDFTDHKPAEHVAMGIAFLCTSGGWKYAGRDFTLKTEEERREAGLPG